MYSCLVFTVDSHAPARFFANGFRAQVSFLGHAVLLFTDKGTLWELYKMIMFGIVDQAPKNWYRQQLDINSYVQVLYNIASIELENETQATELDLDVVNDDSEEQVRRQHQYLCRV